MSTPTDQQQIRATLRRHAREYGATAAVRLAIGSAVGMYGSRVVAGEAGAMLDMGHAALPPLLGASEAADLLGMKATNLKRLSPPLPVAAVISGRIPVYRESDVLDAKRRRDERRAA